MAFPLFLLLNACLFIRPAEIVPDLIGLPIYNVLMIANLAASWGRIVPLLSLEGLRVHPISACVVGLLAAIGLSHASHLQFGLAIDPVVEFGKVVIYYFLLIANLDSSAKIEAFLRWLVVFTAILATLALLEYHHVVDIPALKPINDGRTDSITGETTVVVRLRSTGIYNDPNDLCLILLIAILSSVLALGRKGELVLKGFWVGAIVLCGYALMLTHSRGGFLALLGSLAVLFQDRFGWRRAIPLLALALPVLLVLFGGRQTSINAGEDTGQARVRLWAEAIPMFRQAPLFGVGAGLYPEFAGQVAHNSYIHAYGELGFLGGTLYLGAFAYALWALHRLGKSDVRIADDGLRRTRPFLMAMIVAYGVGTFSLTRNYVVPTYMVLGLAASYLRLVIRDHPFWAPSLLGSVNARLVGRSVMLGCGFLVFAYALIRTLVRYG